MLEPFVRANLHRWQSAYDRLPAPARNLLTSARGLLLSRIRYSPKACEFLGELHANESWTSQQIAAHQLAALQNTFDTARATVPLYSSYPAVRFRSFDDLRRLPILRRETVRQDLEQLLNRSIKKRQLIRASTTGTSGSNLHIAYTEEIAQRNWAFHLRQWSWAGLAPRQPRLTFYGSRVVPADRAKPPYWTCNAPEQQWLMSIFHLSAATAPRYLDFLSAHAGSILEGFPSVLGILAGFALSDRAPIRMRAVLTSGEPLYPSTRREIGRAFGTQVFDTYGMTELCGLIQECERGGMHLAPEYGFLEILDEKEEPVKSGEEGDFVWTGFINSAMPLIRYRIGDRGRWLDEGPCACGRQFPLVVPTITRVSEILRSPDGRLFSPRALNQLLKQTNLLQFCQFVHERPTGVVVRAVPGHASDTRNATAELMRVRADLQKLLGPAIEVTAIFAAQPLAGPGGKIPLIVNLAQFDQVDPSYPRDRHDKEGDSSHCSLDEAIR